MTSPYYIINVIPFGIIVIVVIIICIFFLNVYGKLRSSVPFFFFFGSKRAGEQ